MHNPSHEHVQECERELTDHTDWVRSLVVVNHSHTSSGDRLSVQRDMLVSCSDDLSIRVWDTGGLSFRSSLFYVSQRRTNVGTLNTP